jgi:hypothetical protein
MGMGPHDGAFRREAERVSARGIGYPTDEPDGHAAPYVAASTD